MSERRDPSRRGVIRGSAAVGGGIATAALLAACGGDDAGGQGTDATSTVSGAVAVGDVPVGGGVVIADTETVITQPAAGEYFGFSSICTHQGCPVATVTAEHIICPCHSSHYDTRTGEPVAGPADQPLTPRSITVTETEVEYS
ncbi:Rieske (2Fe-2S) protein [Pseudoclavibacter terrae]|uniref:Cytochrome bc1 complex Rieske iron-sulfur subunit n=1 Tax=Pseudoclavibacter terrae TaxID=1530195 RepID=A0A7J5B636_9MICO|nr:Rieske (2Fe-2S) protein [Pseudoclavibacter terrae]KAB1639636.1 Rieske 2Fe-2S domain-containing protein [Pseudoclavibacter terrae]